jgi:hypothetical protein
MNVFTSELENSPEKLRRTAIGDPPVRLPSGLICSRTRVLLRLVLYPLEDDVARAKLEWDADAIYVTMRIGVEAQLGAGNAVAVL